ncbi:MAG TPA: methyltransferase domain-containing protein [Polyangiaceae bacterium]|nr:methyltransferase domain-containing protein [Polyangiaceae bacterium]
MSERAWLIAQLDAMHQSRGGDWYYRTFAPGRAMADAAGVHVVNLDQAHRRLQQVCEAADVLVVNGVCSADLLPLMAQRKQAGRATVFEINDDVAEIQPSNPLSGFFAQPENIRLFRRLALTADAVQYSVPELERLYGALNRRGRVFLNQLASVPPLRDRAGSELTLGWGGSAGHLEDLAEIAPALIELLQRHPRVVLCLMCSDRIWQLFDSVPAERKRRTPVGSIEQYYAFVGSLDIGLAPNRDKGFNRARSDVKFLECAAYGAVAVVQRLTPYLNSVVHGENGFLYQTTSELVALLERLIDDADERARLRRNAHAYVTGERQQGPHAAERLAFYAEILAKSPAGSDPVRLFAELAALEGAEVSGRHVMLAHTRYESLLHDGLVAMQSGKDRQRGADLLREAARLEPTQALPELFLGSQLDSEAELSAALKKNPRSLQAALALGQLQLEQGRFRQALERFLAAAEMAPGYEMPFVYASRACERLGGGKEAAEFLRLAEGMAQAVTPPARPAPATARAAGSTTAPERPAWHLLDEGVHLQTLNPSYAPTGLLEMIEKPPRRVLDLGCFCGGTGRYLKRKFPGCEVIGIEMLEPAAKLAAEAYDRVHVGTLEQLDFERAGLSPGSFDAIIAADVLEHLFHPWQALQRLRPLLAPGGELFVSLPNARNLKLLSELGRGRFDYAGAGILDVTHVRFFTRKTAVEMLEQTGFVVADVRINPDQRLAAVFEGKRLDQTTRIELDGLSLEGLNAEDLLELAALQLYLRARCA